MIRTPDINRCMLSVLVASVLLTMFSCKGEKKDSSDFESVDNAADTLSDVDVLVEEVSGKFGNNILYFLDGKFVVYGVSDGTTKEYDFGGVDLLDYALKPQSSLLYYYVCDNGNAVLKSVDFADDNPSPVKVVDFGLTCEDCFDGIWGCNSSLLVNDDASVLGVRYGSSMDCFGFCKCKVYYPATGKLKDMDEWQEVFDQAPKVDREAFDTETDGIPKFYYVKNGAKVCVSDKIDMSFAEGDENYIEYAACSLSPDSKKVLYSAGVLLGETFNGQYCVASLDGKYQLALSTDMVECKAIEWLADGSLVYSGEESRPETDPEYSEDNTMRPCIWILHPGSMKPQVLVHDVGNFCIME